MRLRRRTVVGLVGLWALTTVPPTAVAGPAEDAGQRIGDEIARADAARTDGRLADAARIYGEAYALTRSSEEYRGTGVALDVVLLAAQLYREAFKAAQDHALCRESGELLDSFVVDVEALGEPVPQAIRDEQARVATCLDSAPEPEPPVVVEPEVPKEPEVSQDPVDPKPDTQPGDGGSGADGGDDISQPPPRRALPIALVAGGSATTVAGVVLLAVGGSLQGRARDYRTEVMGAPEYTERGPDDQAVIDAALDAYVDSERGRGVGLMAAGGAVVGLGVAAVIVGSIKLARARSGGSAGAEAHRMAPRLGLGRGHLTVGASLRF